MIIIKVRVEKCGFVVIFGLKSVRNVWKFGLKSVYFLLNGYDYIVLSALQVSKYRTSIIPDSLLFD